MSAPGNPPPPPHEETARTFREWLLQAEKALPEEGEEDFLSSPFLSPPAPPSRATRGGAATNGPSALQPRPTLVTPSSLHDSPTRKTELDALQVPTKEIASPADDLDLERPLFGLSRGRPPGSSLGADEEDTSIPTETASFAPTRTSKPTIPRIPSVRSQGAIKDIFQQDRPVPLPSLPTVPYPVRLPPQTILDDAAEDEEPTLTVTKPTLPGVPLPGELPEPGTAGLAPVPSYAEIASGLPVSDAQRWPDLPPRPSIFDQAPPATGLSDLPPPPVRPLPAEPYGLRTGPAPAIVSTAATLDDVWVAPLPTRASRPARRAWLLGMAASLAAIFLVVTVGLAAGVLIRRLSARPQPARLRTVEVRQGPGAGTPLRWQEAAPPPASSSQPSPSSRVQALAPATATRVQTAPLPVDPEPVAALLEQAHLLEESDNHAEAHERFQRALSVEPKNPVAISGLARTGAELGLAEALIPLRRSRRAVHRALRPLLALRLAMVAGDREEASRRYHALSRRQRSQLLAMIWGAEVQQRRGRLVEARLIYYHLLERDPRLRSHKTRAEVAIALSEVLLELRLPALAQKYAKLAQHSAASVTSLPLKQRIDRQLLRWQ